MDTRNPFRIRTSERIDSDEMFLRLFGPDALALLEDKAGLFDKIQVICSAPGAGKTSLLRVFTPSVLTLLDQNKDNPDFGDLTRRLRGLGVLSDSGPSCLGVLLSLARNYSTIEDLAGDPIRSNRALFALLNARLILVGLRGCLLLKKLRYPDDLKTIKIVAPPHNEFPGDIPIPGNGEQLMAWASAIEKKVCRAIDNFGMRSEVALEGHDTLYSLQILNPANILYQGIPIASKTLIMLDDFHELTESQRNYLRLTVSKLRPPVGIWLSQRLEALSPENMFPGATTGREYEDTIFFEDFWNSSNRFQNAVNDIADRRVRTAKNSQTVHFSGKLLASLGPNLADSQHVVVLETVKGRIYEIAKQTQKYADWIRLKENLGGGVYEQAVGWRMLEIMIERDRKRNQMTLNFDIPLAPEVLDDKENSSLKAAAEFLLSEEFKIPYYFGPNRLAALASYNIDQFLAFSGDLFEEMISSELTSTQTALPADRQQAILKGAVSLRWNAIPRKTSYGKDVQTFLKAIHDCAKWEMSKGTASYGAGGAVTGIAITMKDRDILIDKEGWVSKPEFKRLVLVLSSCIANNLLDASLNRSQGTRDKRWMILYLNRWLCLQFNLPLQLGGWRPKGLSELSGWLEHGFRQPDKKATTT